MKLLPISCMALVRYIVLELEIWWHLISRILLVIRDPLLVWLAEYGKLFRYDIVNNLFLTLVVLVPRPCLFG